MATEVPDFVEEQGAAVGEFKLAHAAGRRIGKRALFVAEQLAFDQRLGEGGAVQRYKRAVPPSAVVMQGLGDQFLAGAALTGDQHRCPAVGDLFDLAVNLLHWPTFADEVVKRISLSHLCTQLFDFAFELLRVERAVHDDPEFFDVERLREIVCRPQLHGIDRRFHGLRAGQHDDRGRVLLRPQRLENR